MISFVGAGPGAPDLLTIRGAQRLAEADIVVWASSLVPEAVLAHCRPTVVLFDSKTMTLEEITAVYSSNPEAAIVRLHSGDPSVYGAIAEQIDWCLMHEVAFEIVPGVTSMAAAAAAIGQELTLPGVSQSVVLTRLGQPHPVLHVAARGRVDVRRPRRHDGDLPFGRPPARAPGPVALLGIALHTRDPGRHRLPGVVARRAHRSHDRRVPGRLPGASSAQTATVLVLVGPALAPIADPQRSHVYSSSYAHTFRAAGE